VRRRRAMRPLRVDYDAIGPRYIRNALSTPEWVPSINIYTL